jgi:hypothetical protein
MPLWQEILFGWILGFVLPKSIIFPIFRGMYRSMRRTEELDAQDRRWLAEQSRGDGGQAVPTRFRPRRRRPPPEGPRPARHVARRP